MPFVTPVGYLATAMLDQNQILKENMSEKKVNKKKIRAICPDLSCFFYDLRLFNNNQLLQQINFNGAAKLSGC